MSCPLDVLTERPQCPGNSLTLSLWPYIPSASCLIRCSGSWPLILSWFGLRSHFIQIHCSFKTTPPIAVVTLRVPLSLPEGFQGGEEGPCLSPLCPSGPERTLHDIRNTQRSSLRPLRLDYFTQIPASPTPLSESSLHNYMTPGNSGAFLKKEVVL